MTNTLDVISQMLPPLSNIKHPLEGCFYLLVSAVLFRWIYPITWNKFLKSISAANGSKVSNNNDS